MSLSFGTDGVRGVANTELTPELALALGRATARVLGPTPSVVVGRDTRRSGPMLEAAFVAGLAGSAPTGVERTDVVLTALLAAVVTALGARATPVALAVSAAVPTIAFSGVTDVQQEAWDLVEGLAPAYGDHWWYISLLAFTRQDQGRFEEAGWLAESALTCEPSSGHAVHAQTHVNYETGQHESGRAWLDHWVAESDHSLPGAAIKSPVKATHRPSMFASRLMEPTVCPGVGTTVNTSSPNGSRA